MKAAEGRAGRVFVLQLGAEDKLPGCLERFAAENGVLAAQVVVQTRAGGQKSGGALAVGVLALDHHGHPALSLSGDLGEADASGALSRDVCVQEWLGMQVLRVEDPKTGAALLSPSIRPAGQTQVLQRHMLDLALARAAGHAAPRSAPSMKAATLAPASASSVAAEIAAPEAKDETPPAPATIAVYLLGAELN